MSDNLEEVLKQAVKKIIADAMIEAAGQHAIAGQAAMVSVPASVPTQKAMQAFSIWREKLKFVSKSAACAACAAFTCGIIGITLFAPELAQAAVGGDLYGHQYYALPDTTIDSASGRPVEDVSWKDLANMNKVEEMLKEGAILHAAPGDLSAIVIFFMLRKMAKGERIDINNLQESFKDSLPEAWHPVYNAVVEEYPQLVMPPVPNWFSAPK